MMDDLLLKSLLPRILALLHTLHLQKGNGKLVAAAVPKIIIFMCRPLNLLAAYEKDIILPLGWQAVS